jgi:hypothetical protein
MPHANLGRPDLADLGRFEFPDGQSAQIRRQQWSGFEANGLATVGVGFNDCHRTIGEDGVAGVCGHRERESRLEAGLVKTRKESARVGRLCETIDASI